MPKNAEVAQAIANVEQEEATSPWGEFLRHQKRSHEYKHKLETNAIKSLINPKKADWLFLGHPLWFNFIKMYDNLDDCIIHRRFAPTPKPFPSSKLNDFSAVEPWEKTTLEIIEKS